MDLVCLKTKEYKYQHYVNSFYNAYNENALYIISNAFTNISNEKMHYLMYLSAWNINMSIPYKYIIYRRCVDYNSEICIYGKYIIDIIYRYNEDYKYMYHIKSYNNRIFYIWYEVCHIIMRFDLYGNLIHCNIQNMKRIQEMKDGLKTSKIDFPKYIYT